MRQKVIGIVLLILGFYFLVINPVLSILIHGVFDLRIAYLRNVFTNWYDILELLWLWITILVAGVGVVFIKYGRRNVLASQA
ncbi:MAG: hypothetical protein KGD68_15890 [Candidatus Lokiarchaeota archaeon]|nr:hypothetical protein [Candidatus Lokiarchaeota archaeon]